MPGKRKPDSIKREGSPRESGSIKRTHNTITTVIFQALPAVNYVTVQSYLPLTMLFVWEVTQ